MQNVVNFDEIPTIKDSKPSTDDHKQIDFFGAGLENDEDDVMNPNDFEKLEEDFVRHNNNQSADNKSHPFGQSITKEVLRESKREAIELGNKKNLQIEIDENDDYNA